LGSSRGRRGIRPGLGVGTAATLIATLVATLAGPTGVADAASCAPTPGVLSGKPVTTLKLPKKATARVWDTGDEARQIDEVRIAAVTIPAKSLIPKIVAGSSLSDLNRLYQLAGRNTVAMINGAVWDEWDPGVPMGSQMLGGVVRKGDSAPTRALAAYGKTRTLAVAQVAMSGTAVATRGGTPIASVRIGAVNWQDLSRTGATLFTSAWGAWEHDVGQRTVVISGGKVTRVISGYDIAADAPPAGSSYLTARWGSAVADQLAQLQVGDKVAVNVEPSGKLQYQKRATGIGHPTGLMGLSAPIVEGGKIVYGCSRQSEIRRPRSIIGWKKNGDVLLVTISGRAFAGELRVGGASVHQAATYLKQLGAVTAVALDGGNSTTLLVRKKAGGPLIRLDRSQSEYQRPITDAVAFDLR
jgi:hypothetical protein